MTQFHDDATATTSSGAATRMLVATAMLLSPLWLLPLVYLASQRSSSYNLQSFANLDKFLYLLGAFALISLIGLVWLVVSLPREIPRISRWLARLFDGALTIKHWIFRAALLQLALLALGFAFKSILPSWSEQAGASSSAAVQTTQSADTLPRSAGMTGRPFFMDASALLTPMQGHELNARLQRFQAKSGHTLVVLIVPDLAGQSIEAFSRGRFSEWGIGRAGLDDGILVVVARQERRMRIELGRGFKAIEPDTQQLIHELGQAFSRGEFYGGISVCVDALMAKAS